MAVLTREERLNKFMFASGLDSGERNVPTLTTGLLGAPSGFYAEPRGLPHLGAPALGIPALAAPTAAWGTEQLRQDWRCATPSRSDFSYSLTQPSVSVAAAVSSNSSQVSCPFGHAIQYTTRASPWSCDMCQRVSTRAPMQRFRCTMCDYDLCEICHDAAAKQARAREVAREQDLQASSPVAAVALSLHPPGMEDVTLQERHGALTSAESGSTAPAPQDDAPPASISLRPGAPPVLQRASHDRAMRACLGHHRACDESLQARSTQSCSGSPGAAREDAILAGGKLLQARCKYLGLEQEAVEDDGNCQFRAIAQELFGSQEHHGEVRAAVVDFLKRRSADFSAFTADDEWAGYLRQLAEPRAWGDELALRAAAEAYQIRVHVVSSTAENWYLVYEPEGGAPTGARDVFLTYIAPIHYNVLKLASSETSLPEDGTLRGAVERESSSPRLARLLKGLAEAESRQSSQGRQLPGMESPLAGTNVKHSSPARSQQHTAGSHWREPLAGSPPSDIWMPAATTGSPTDIWMPAARHSEKTPTHGSLWVPYGGHSAVSSLAAPAAAGQPLGGVSGAAFQQNRSSQGFSSPWVAQSLSGTRFDDGYDAQAGYSPYGEWRTHTGPSGRLGASSGTPRADRRSMSSVAARGVGPATSAASSVHGAQNARRHAARGSSPVPRSNSPLPGRPRTPIRRPTSASAAVRHRSIEAGRGSIGSPMRHSVGGSGVGNVPMSAEKAAAEAATFAAEAAAQRLATGSYLHGDMARRFRGDAGWWSRTPTHDVAGSYARARSPMHYAAAPRLSHSFQGHNDWASSLRR